MSHSRSEARLPRSLGLDLTVFKWNGLGGERDDLPASAAVVDRGDMEHGLTELVEVRHLDVSALQ